MDRWRAGMDANWRPMQKAHEGKKRPNCHTIHFMDVSILPASSSSPLLTTKLFDRRTTPTFAALPIVRYVHITSMIAYVSKYNTVVSQFHRFRRLILDKDNFCASMADVLARLHARGYASGRMLSKLRYLLHIRNHTMYATSAAYLFHTIKRRFNDIKCRPQ
jgi:hypothetical protein